MSKDYGPQVRLARVYEKTSKTGNQYFAGRIGMAKVAILKSREVAEDGGAMWDILLAEGGVPDKRSTRSDQGVDTQAPPADRSPLSGATPRSGTAMDDTIPFAPERR